MVQSRETKNRGLGTIVTSIQDSKPREKQISLTFSYFLITNALLYHFLATWLAHNKKMTEKSVFRGAWGPKLTSQSLPVSCFWCRGFVPHRKWNLALLAHQNTGKENRYWKFFFATLISTLGRFNRANKKKSVMCTLRSLLWTQAAQTLFVIYIRDSIALRFEPFKRMYENGSKIALNSTCSKGFK